MTTLTGRPLTALLVVDVQEGVVAEAVDRDPVIDRIAALVERARDERVPLVWVQPSDEGLAQGSAEWQFVPGLRRRPEEPLVHKRHGDAVVPAASVGFTAAPGPTDP